MGQRTTQGTALVADVMYLHPLTRACTLMVLSAWLTVGLANAKASELFAHDDRYLELSISPDFTEETRLEVSRWAQFLANSLLQAYGRWPQQHWRINVAPASAVADDPIPWAQVVRGTITTVEFYVSPQSTTERLKRAWTGYHEMGHLLIPYRGWGDLWFSEGLASYYQNLLQARAGTISEREMWQRIHDGLQRGTRDTGFSDQPLHAVSDAMHNRGGFMRVYWSGARYFLELDVRLRRQSGGRLNLDLALQRLNDCCANRKLAARDIARLLDEHNDVVLFQPLYERTRESLAVAPADKLFASLGINVADGTVSLQPSGPGARLRREIATARALPF